MYLIKIDISKYTNICLNSRLFSATEETFETRMQSLSMAQAPWKKMKS